MAHTPEHVQDTINLDFRPIGERLGIEDTRVQTQRLLAFGNFLGAGGNEESEIFRAFDPAVREFLISGARGVARAGKLSTPSGGTAFTIGDIQAEITALNNLSRAGNLRGGTAATDVLQVRFGFQGASRAAASAAQQRIASRGRGATILTGPSSANQPLRPGETRQPFRTAPSGISGAGLQQLTASRALGRRRGILGISGDQEDQDTTVLGV